ncbi:MAG: cell division protein ZapA [Calditrichaeota bacterium]|nr:cell division protein ZapA [Calditrichota bacterium]MCB9366328.1 cell division protein ZapA [Calditrichota bacterium]
MTDFLHENTPEEAVEVTIFDRAYKLKRTAEPDYLRRVAGLVDERMKSVHLQDRSRPAGELAVLAALQLAHELTEAKGELLDQTNKVTAEAQRLEQTLDEKLREWGA